MRLCHNSGVSSCWKSKLLLTAGALSPRKNSVELNQRQQLHYHSIHVCLSISPKICLSLFFIKYSNYNLSGMKLTLLVTHSHWLFLHWDEILTFYRVGHVLEKSWFQDLSGDGHDHCSKELFSLRVCHGKLFRDSVGSN